jgi:pimeloyl-ACP methyl ester carboxylesterase
MASMRTIQNGSVKLNVREAGEVHGTPTLFIHGLNTNLAFWHEDLLARLAGGRRLLLSDLRGHGYSDLAPSGYTSASLATDALAVLDAHGVATADVVAHSFGTTVALQLARLHPQRVRSLVLLDGRTRLFQADLKLGDWVQFETWRRHFTAAGIDLSPDLDLDFTLPLRLHGCDLSKVIPGLREDGFFVPATGSRAAEKYRRLLTETTASDDFRDLAGLDHQALASVRQPSLLVYGSLSPFLPTRDGLARVLPDCRSEVIDGGGHNFLFMRPQETAAVIRSFWTAGRAAREVSL